MLLKPVDPAELAEVFRRVRENLDRTRAEQRNIDRLRSAYQQSIPMLQENFTISLIEGRVPGERLGQYLQSYDMGLNGPLYVAALLHVSGTKQPDDRESLLFMMSVRRLAEEQLGEDYRIKTANYLGDLAVIAQLKNETDITGFTDRLDALCRQAKRMFDVAVTAGVGTVCSDLLEIRRSFRGARNAVSYRAIYGNTRAISIAEVDPETAADETGDREAVRTLLTHLRMGRREELDRELGRVLEGIRESGAGIFRYQSFMMELISGINEFAAVHQLDAESILGGQQRIYRAVFESESPEETGSWLSQVADRIDRELKEKRTRTTTSFVEKAKVYVQDNYADTEVTVDSVCSYLGLSSAYFSTVFKKETGTTFISYLTDYRMERAVELLRTTDDKTYMIAGKVGYADSNYFSYVFKKKFGISPSKFRAQGG